jgi:hypothetical protein
VVQILLARENNNRQAKVEAEVEAWEELGPGLDRNIVVPRYLNP